MTSIIGKKIGMTSIFDTTGKQTAVTIIEAGPCVVTQKKTVETDGYNALQIAFGDKKEKHSVKAEITVSGKCKTVDTEASSGSEITASKLMSEEGKVDASSGASINIFCSVSLTADASSGSKVLYSGNPQKTAIDASSGGVVRKLN